MDSKEQEKQTVAENIQDTMINVTDQYVKVLKTEQVIRKDLINTTLHQLQDIQKEKQEMDTLLEINHEIRMQQIDSNEQGLEEALSSGNIEDIENALKKLIK